MNRVEALAAVLDDVSRSETEKTNARKALNDIAASNSVDANEREAARRAIGRRGTIDDLLGLSPRPTPSGAPAPSKPVEIGAACPETVKPEPKAAPEPTRTDKERSAKIARLSEVLKGAQTNMQELSALLEPKMKELLRIDYAQEIKLKKLQENLLLAERRKHLAEQAFQEQFQPIVIGNRKFHVDPAVRAELLAIRDRGSYTIRNCTKHKRERCGCFWDNARPELLGFRDRYGPAFDEYKAANAIWGELEAQARNHIPGRPGPLPEFPTEHLEDIPNPEWLGRRKS